MTPKLFLGACCLGFAPIFVKLVSIGPTPIGIYRCGIAAVLLTCVSRWESPRAAASARWSPALWGYLLLSGFLFAVDLFVWHRSVIYAGAGLGTILGNTQVFYVTLIGIVFFGERLTWRFLFAVLLAFTGVFLLVSYRSSPATEDRYVEGVFYGLATGIVYSSYVLAIRKAEQLSRGVSSTLRLAIVSGTTAIFLLPIAWWEGTLGLPTPVDFGWLLSLALVAQVAGWLLISRSLGQVPVSRAGLILTAQPLVATLAGGLLLREHLSPLQGLGAGIVLVALYLGTTRR